MGSSGSPPSEETGARPLSRRAADRPLLRLPENRSLRDGLDHEPTSARVVVGLEVGAKSHVETDSIKRTEPTPLVLCGAGVSDSAVMSGCADYEQYDALGLADLVRRREVSPTELLGAG